MPYKKMYQYLKTGSCKRQFIAQYFGDRVENVHSSDTCCGADQPLPLEKLGLLGESVVRADGKRNRTIARSYSNCLKKPN